MLRRDLLRSGGTVGAVAGCMGGDDSPAFQEGVEDGLGDWESDAAIGPEVDIEEFEWEGTVSGEQTAVGERSLRISNEGDATHNVDEVSLTIEPR